MIKVFGAEDQRKYVETHIAMQASASGLNYPIDCPWVYLTAQVKPTDVVLDVGCGGGGISLFLAPRCAQVYGLDAQGYPIFHVEVARRNLANIRFVQAEAKSMPFPDGFFDVAVSVSALEHNEPEELRLAVREICRVLKPGGRLVATGAVAQSGDCYFKSEAAVIDSFTNGTGMELEDPTSLTSWRFDSEEVKQKFAEYLAAYPTNQNWLPVGVVCRKK